LCRLICAPGIVSSRCQSRQQPTLKRRRDGIQNAEEMPSFQTGYIGLRRKVEPAVDFDPDMSQCRLN